MHRDMSKREGCGVHLPRSRSRSLLQLLSCLSFRSGRAGMVTLLFRVVRTESILGLWKGVSPVSGWFNSDF